MAGIRVQSAVKKIEVNDNGEYISLNLGDSSFPERFFAMVDNIQKRAGGRDCGKVRQRKRGGG